MNKVKIKLNYYSTTDGEPVHRMEFDGVFYDVIGAGVTKREEEIFMSGILAERERLWDESADLVDEEIMRKLLKDEKDVCKNCEWSGWPNELLEDTKPVYLDKEIIGYHTDWLCPKCRNIIKG